MGQMPRRTVLLLAALVLLACIVPGAEAALTLVKVKRWIEYASVCCCTFASFACTILVFWFLTNKSSDEENDPWADFDPDDNSTDNATDAADTGARLLSAAFYALTSLGEAIDEKLH
eukprot:gb/GFBE01073306.1/.p1 GENE.gb/GFBE01073306.1/~~gb/GFBE01073306.1/.p1  ORF type:complete len:117 (+),score=18.66 gb/GFBE01073306.1/:1-351(+)